MDTFSFVSYVSQAKCRYTCFNNRRRLVNDGKLSEKVAFKTLSEIEPNTIAQVLSFQTTETRMGEAVLLDSIIWLDDNQKERVRLMVAKRHQSECEKKVPCLIYYEGIKKLSDGKSCHNLHFISPDDPMIFYEEEKTPTTRSRGTKVADEKDDEVMSDYVAPCESCAMINRVCPGRCSKCDRHLYAGQCNCDEIFDDE